MKTLHFLHFLRRAMLLFIGLSFFPASIIAQGYWSQNPSLPSQCYSGQDTFRQTADDLQFEIKEKMEIIKKADCNKKMKHLYKNGESH